MLFLDEPTSGVDPLARRAFWRMINRLADAGTAILVTTHYLEEAEQCNRLGLMVAGELVAEGTPTGIKSQQQGHLLEFARRPAAARDGSAEDGRWSAGGCRCSAIGFTSSPTTTSEAGSGPSTKTLEARRHPRLSAREARFSLEDVFISVVEQARRKGKVASRQRG